MTPAALVRVTVLPDGMTTPSMFPVSALAAATASRRVQLAPGQLPGTAGLSSPKLVTVKVWCTVENGMNARGCTRSDIVCGTFGCGAAPAGVETTRAAPSALVIRPTIRARPPARLNQADRLPRWCADVRLRPA